MTILLAILIIYWYSRVKSQGPPNLRTFSALQAIEEGAERCAEEGTIALMFPSVGGLRGTQVSMTMAYLNFLRYMTGELAKRGIEIMAPAGSDISIVPLQQAAIREAYTSEGRPEIYNDNMVEFYGSSAGYLFACLSALENPGASLSVAVGSLGGSSPTFMGASRQHGAITVGGALRWTAMYGVAILCDYILIADEVYAASEKIGADPINIGALAAIDVMKAVVILLGIVGVLGVFLNIPIVEWMMR
jgi:hypothetical protein